MKTYNGMTYKYVKDEWKGSTRNEVYFEEHEYGLWKNINSLIKIRLIIDDEEYMEGHWWEEYEEGHSSCGFNELSYSTPTYINDNISHHMINKGDTTLRSELVDHLCDEPYYLRDKEHISVEYLQNILSQEPIKQREDAMSRIRVGYYDSSCRAICRYFNPKLIKVKDYQRLEDLKNQTYEMEYMLSKIKPKIEADSYLCENGGEPMTFDDLKTMKTLIGNTDDVQI